MKLSPLLVSNCLFNCNLLGVEARRTDEWIGGWIGGTIENNNTMQHPVIA